MNKRAATTIAAILLSSFPAVMVGQAHAETRATRVKSVTVDYGHGPVAQDHPGQRVRISFSGTAGDQVRLLTDRAYGALRGCEQVTLSDDTGLLSRDRSSFWPVPRDGVHVFEFVPCDEATEPVTLQLIRLRVTPLDPSGSTPMPAGHYVEALEVTVPATGTLAIRPTENGAFFSQVLPPTGPLRRASGVVALFEPGRSLLRLGSPADPAMPRNLTRPMQAGERFLLLTNWDAMLISSVVPEHHVTVDGNGVTIAALSPSVHHLAFTASAGDLVFASHAKPTGWRDQLGLTLLTSDGSVVADSGFPELWRIPETGSYRLVVVTHDPLLSSSLTLALRSVRSIGSLRPDGAPRAFVATAPGQPVLATVDLKKRTRYALRATGVRLPRGWAGRIAPSSPSGCLFSGQRGCRTQVGYVDAAERTSATFRRGSNPNPWLVLMDPGDGATGRVTLAVTSKPAAVP